MNNSPSEAACRYLPSWLVSSCSVLYTHITILVESEPEDTNFWLHS